MHLKLEVLFSTYLSLTSVLLQLSVEMLNRCYDHGHQSQILSFTKGSFYSNA